MAWFICIPMKYHYALPNALSELAPTLVQPCFVFGVKFQKNQKFLKIGHIFPLLGKELQIFRKINYASLFALEFSLGRWF